MKYKFNSYCLNAFLAFRYVPKPNISWIHEKNIFSFFKKPTLEKKIGVKNYKDIIYNLSKISKKYQNKKTGILLSSGIDSAIIAKFLPKNTCAYTIKFIAPNYIDEVDQAVKIANYLNINHKVVEVRWRDYEAAKNELMLHKKSPLHPAEIAIYLAALEAKKDGVDYLFSGGGADATFGGMDRLLSIDWNYKDFIKRYNFTNPKNILKEHVDITNVYKKYKIKNSIDVENFLKEVFGLGTAQMFDNAIIAAGCEAVAPFSKLFLDDKLNIDRIRNGESKYILGETYKALYPSLKMCNKIPFVRPMDQWMKSWNDVHRLEFKQNIDFDSLTGEQKWLIYCLQEFMDLLEKE